MQSLTRVIVRRFLQQKFSLTNSAFDRVEGAAKIIENEYGLANSCRCFNIYHCYSEFAPSG
jgi:hypothetical protein